MYELMDDSLTIFSHLQRLFSVERKGLMIMNCEFVGVLKVAVVSVVAELAGATALPS
jgi:hypothetical protein